MKKVFFLFLFLLIPLVHAQSQVNDYNDYKSLTLGVDFTSRFELEQEAEGRRVDFVVANLSFFPQNDVNLDVEKLQAVSTPPAQVSQTQNMISYQWLEPQEQRFNFGFRSKVKAENALVAVKDKILFPIDPVEEEYTKPTEFIDINPGIRQQAAQLATGEDDLFVVAFKVGDWVEKNVKYDLNTLTADVVKPSSWVFQYREGVCDELTNLFLSMMRSLGVPGRFVSGLAYSNIGHQWGPHGWAELYFPKKGWVPFDVTYGQLGWVDPTHIKLKVSVDSGDSSVKYLWRAFGVKFKSEKINLTAFLQDSQGKVGRQADFSIRPLVNNVGPGSYVPLEITITSQKEYYLPESFVMTKAPELTEKNVKRVLLKPQGTGHVYWTAILPKDADPGFAYTTFLEVEDFFHSVASANISYSRSGKVYSKQEANTLISVNENSQEDLTSSDLVLSCKGPDYMFSYERAQASCSLQNRGKDELNDVQICRASECRTVSLGVGQERTVNISLGELKVGLNRVGFTAQATGMSARDDLLVNVLQSPDLVLTGINVPQAVNYDENFNVSFILSVKVPVQNVEIFINNHSVTTIPNLESSKKVIITGFASDYVRRKAADIHIHFNDENGKEYDFLRSVPVSVENVPWFIQALMWLRII